jgi:glycosyltransferase involved in cell wall biosynthesis
MKIFTYIGAGCPIVATEGTAAGDFVKDHRFGWCIPYEEDAIAAFLRQLKEARALLEEARRSIAVGALEHRWECRAQQVIAALDVQGARKIVARG